jgi:hypothetical protein
MASTAPSPQAVNADAFVADRVAVWARFCRMFTVGAITVAAIVILLALFLG